MKNSADFNAENTDAADPVGSAASKGAGEPGEHGGPRGNGSGVFTGPKLRPLASAARKSGSLSREVAKFFRDAREQLGLSQVEMAQRLGITERALGSTERAQSLPKIETVLRVYDLLDGVEWKSRVG